MKQDKIVIVSHGHGNNTDVFLNGNRLKYVQSFGFSVKVGEPAHIYIDSIMPETSGTFDIKGMKRLIYTNKARKYIRTVPIIEYIIRAVKNGKLGRDE